MCFGGEQQEPGPSPNPADMGAAALKLGSPADTTSGISRLMLNLAGSSNQSPPTTGQIAQSPTGQ